jgi:hypothetical protein
MEISVLDPDSYLPFARNQGQAQRDPPTATNTPTPRQLRILSQPDAPLRIVSADVTWATPSDRAAVQIYVKVENAGGPAVRAYSIRRDGDSLSGEKVCLSDSFLPGKVLRPGQQTGRSTWQNDYKLQPSPAVWIDYVELSDGTVWGKDDCRFADYLEGARTGAKTQREILLRILREQGPDAVLNFIHQNFESPEAIAAMERGEKLKIPPEAPTGHSKLWEDGFAFGAKTIVRRVVDGNREWGITEIEVALRRPYDASESK